MHQHLASPPARTAGTPAGSLAAPRPFSTDAAAARVNAPRASHEFGAVAVGPARSAPSDAPIQRQLRRRGPDGRWVSPPANRVVQAPEPVRPRRPVRPVPAPSVAASLGQAASQQLTTVREQRSQQLAYGASAVSAGLSLVAGSNPVSTLLNTATTARSAYDHLARGAVEFRNGEYGNGVASSASGLAGVGGYVAGLLHVPGAGVAATAATTSLSKLKQKVKTE